MSRPARIVLCAKSTWDPAVRREHAIALQAARAGHQVVFLERPADVREARRRPRRWLRALAGRAAHHAPVPGLEVIRTAVVAPGHRSDAAERQATVLLARRLRGVVRSGDVVVATQPWQWPALGLLRPGVRRCFDCADDWGTLIPQRAARFGALYLRIGAEADAVVTAAADGAALFGGAEVRHVPNGVARELLDAAPRPRRDRATLVYAGTLSPRFDAPLVTAALERLPGWRLELYGQCQYPGRGQEPDEELARLLALGPDRVRWHGVVERAGLPAALDAAAVALLPNRAELTAGQSSMKLYDYAARGRPVVTSRWIAQDDPAVPPGTRFVSDAAELAAAVEAAASEPADLAAERRSWVAGHTWEARWERWAGAMLGA